MAAPFATLSFGVAAGLALFSPPGPGPSISDVAASPSVAHWSQHALVRVLRASPKARAWIREHTVDDWDEWRPGRDVVLRAASLETLATLDVEFQILSRDLGQAVSREQRRLGIASSSATEPGIHRNLPTSVLEPAFFDDYRDFETMLGAWRELPELAPDRVHLETIGQSVEARPLEALRFGRADAPHAALFIFGQHAREWISPATGLCLAARLTQSQDPALVALLDEVQIWIVPLVNPDGYVYSWTDDRFWRKNRSPDLGVDLNRNWSAGWGLEPGSSDDPENNDYRGPAAFSEPETAAVRDLADTLDELELFVDVHAYSQLVLYPLSYLSFEVPELQGLTRAWAESVAGSMMSLYGVEYTPLRGSDLYPAAGVAMDYGFEALGVPAFTFELRPSGEVEFPLGFILPPEEIVATCDEVELGLMTLAEWATDGGPPPVEPPPPHPPETGDETAADVSTDTFAESEADTSDTGTQSSGGDGRVQPGFDRVRTGCACESTAPSGGGPARMWFAFFVLASLRRPARHKRPNAA